MPKGIYKRTKKHLELLKKARSFIVYRPLSKEHKEKISQSHKGTKKPWVSKIMTGRKLLEKTKRKLSKALFDCHHIDYNKENCEQENLITLCRKCHAKTNFNRNYWKDYFCIITRRYLETKLKKDKLKL